MSAASATPPRHELTRILLSQRLIGIVRTPDASSARRAAEAMVRGGLQTLEITLTTPGATQVIHDLRADHPGLLVGVGTVMDASAATTAILAGAQFVISPHLSADVVATAHRYGLPVVPGTGTVSEVVRALELGADAVKVFPASSLGPAWISDVRAAVPQAVLVPTGGVRLNDVLEWLRAGAAACGVGSALTAGEPDAAAERISLLMRQIGDV